MSPEQGELVRESWGRIAHQGDELAGFVYAQPFKADPALRRLFPRDMLSQHHKLMKFLGVVVNGSSCLDQLEFDIEDLGLRQLEYGVKPEHFPLVRVALLGTFEHLLGQSYTAAMADGWGAIYDHLARTKQRSAYLPEGARRSR